MRARVVRVAMIAVSVALVLFAVPLAILVWSSLLTEEQGELERVALAVAVRVGPQFLTGDPVDLPAAEADNTIGVYDLGGRLKSGHGPEVADDVVRQAFAGAAADGQAGADLVVAVPVSAAEHVNGVVRTSAPMSVVWTRAFLAWSLLAALAGAALVVAVLVARRQARLLTEPLEDLSGASERIADGDLGARAEPGDIPEINRVALAHNLMVDRLTQLLERQSHFSADASHQLRTPLSGLLLELEAARAAPPADLPRVLDGTARGLRDLARTVEDLLTLSRQHPEQWLTATPHAAGEVLAAAEHRWHGPLAREGRRLVVDIDADVEGWPVPASLLTQIVDVLADNAARHGRGTVTLTARETSGVLAVDVADEGTMKLNSADVFVRGASSGGGHGIGLALARTIAEAGGGRLTVTRRTPTTFTLYLPPVGAGSRHTRHLDLL
ncbi:HAMP domain-containing sensor histidine kinase [Amycolatopsis mediterranei]|uniref:sensor histidine kinase n=1 Tax=Amycolatopsis mediterranei TaxID=33910 RepID=UPI00343AD54D